MRAHFLDSSEPIDPARLREEGVVSGRYGTAPGDYQATLDELKAQRGYVEQDIVELSPKTENLDAICAKFVDEHLHDEDEVRFVLSGAGIFDIRSRDDRWMRVEVETGDLIVVPQKRYHRFMLTDAKAIRCVRLFKDASGWVPHYRQ